MYRGPARDVRPSTGDDRNDLHRSARPFSTPQSFPGREDDALYAEPRCGRMIAQVNRDDSRFLSVGTSMISRLLDLDSPRAQVFLQPDSFSRRRPQPCCHPGRRSSALGRCPNLVFVPQPGRTRVVGCCSRMVRRPAGVLVGFTRLASCSVSIGMIAVIAVEPRVLRRGAVSIGEVAGLLDREPVKIRSSLTISRRSALVAALPPWTHRCRSYPPATGHHIQLRRDRRRPLTADPTVPDRRRRRLDDDDAAAPS